MKKLFALLMAGMMVLALCACVPEEATENPANQEEVVPDVKDENAKDAAEKKEENAENVPDVKDENVQQAPNVKDENVQQAPDVKDENAAIEKNAPAPAPKPAQ